MQALIANDDYAGAFDLAQRIAEVIPNDPQLHALDPSYSAPVHLRTEPAGARVYFRPYENTDADWRLIGETPLEGVAVPIGVGIWRFEYAGGGTALHVFRNPGVELRSVKDPARAGDFRDVDFTLRLGEPEAIPKAMVFVPPTNLLVSLVSDGKPVELPGYFIDRFEVTNRDYKQFVEAGGYREASYWEDLPFGSDVADWQDAVGRFVDATGRPGPSTWESGTFPDGTGDHPVAGVSWFEAMAYARFHGKELPTAYHWYRAAYSLNEHRDSVSSAVVTLQQLRGQGGRSSRPVPGHRSVRHARYGRQRPRVAVDSDGRHSRHRRRRLERTAVPLQRDRLGEPLGSLAGQRLSLHANAVGRARRRRAA